MASTSDFPITKTKTPGLNQVSDLADPAARKKYFEAKVGPEIAKLKDYLQDHTFIAYLLGKKNSGKGTYTKLMAEIFGSDKIAHLSVGDLVRSVHADLADPVKRQGLEEYLQTNYRGYLPAAEALAAMEKRDTSTLLPTEFILALLKREIAKRPKVTIFIDGFPRDIDQISYALFFRDLINYREDPDVFVAISIPEAVINERMKSRVVCPLCKTPRTTKLLPTKKVGYDEAKQEYYLICDNEACGGARMVGKEGDDLGIEAIRDRLTLDETLIHKVLELQGVPKVLLRNAVPAAIAKDYVDDYEITPEYYYERDSTGQVLTKEKPWTTSDDDGTPSYSLLAAPVVVSLIKQLAQVLGL